MPDRCWRSIRRRAGHESPLLGRRIAGGIVNVKYGHTARLRRVRLNECGDPVPDENGLRGAGEITRMAQDAGEDDLLLCVISGGASALMPLPADGLTLEDKPATHARVARLRRQHPRAELRS